MPFSATPCVLSDTVPIAGSPCKCDSHSMMNECTVGEYCWSDHSCQKNPKTTPCMTSDTVPISGKPCKCASNSMTNECNIGNFCWSDNSCEENPKIHFSVTPCVLNDTTAIAGSPCKCSSNSMTNDCFVGQFCWSDHSCQENPKTTSPSSSSNATPCVTSDLYAISGSPCKCASNSITNECSVGKYCWSDNTCQQNENPNGNFFFLQ